MFSSLIAGGLLAAVASVIGAGINAYSQYKTNKVNQEINQTNLDFNASQTQAAWERDDTAHQREVADLKAAGLSPLASTNGLSVSNPLGSPAPIAMQAPQVDTNALINSIASFSSLEEQKRHNIQTESARNSELQIEAAKVTNQANQLNIENKKVESEIKYYARLNELEAEKLDETIRSHKKNEELNLSENEAHRLEIQSKMYLEDIKKQLNGENIPYREIYDIEIYQNALKLWNLQFSHFIDSIGATKKSFANASGSSANGSLAFGVTVPGQAFNVAPSASGGSSENSYKMESYDLSELQEREWQKFVSTHPRPVFVDKTKYDRMYK